METENNFKPIPKLGIKWDDFNPVTDYYDPNGDFLQAKLVIDNSKEMDSSLEVIFKLHDFLKEVLEMKHKRPKYKLYQMIVGLIKQE